MRKIAEKQQRCKLVTSANRKTKQKRVPDTPGEANQCVNSIGLLTVFISLPAGIVLKIGLGSVTAHRGNVKH